MPKRYTENPYNIQAKDTSAFDPQTRAPLAGNVLMDKARELGGGTCLLSFSCGKDSIAMWLYLRDKINVVPFYMYWIPGLSFVDEALDYYEQYFGQRIIRVPHPIFYEFLNKFCYQPPERVAIIRAYGMPNYDFAEVDRIIARQAGLDNPFCAMGVRLADNMQRRRLIFMQGVLGLARRRYFYPIWDWNVNDVGKEIIKHGVKLPADYRAIGRTIGTFEYRYLHPIKKHFPEDYKKILFWFPLIETEIFRYEQIKNRPKKNNHQPA